MSGKLRLNGATSGYSELQAPDVAGDQTFTLPAVGGELVTKQGGESVVGYQQGVWTPTWVQGISPDAYNATTGKWARNGNLVYISGRIQGSGGSTGNSVVRLGKLPYKQAANTGEGAVTFGFPGSFFGSPPYPFWALITANEDFFTFFTNSGEQLTGLDVAAIANTLHFSASYLTDDTTWQPTNGALIS